MIDDVDGRLIEILQAGLPVTPRPYAEIGRQLRISEQEVIERLQKLKWRGVIKRWGVIVNHRKLGYQANAMVVFNIPDQLVDQIGAHISQMDFVNLCYQRPRQGTDWPYNLYCMIHGKNREKVMQQLDTLIESCGVGGFNKEVLFSVKCFKQRGAIYNISADQWGMLTNG